MCLNVNLFRMSEVQALLPASAVALHSTERGGNHSWGRATFHESSSNQQNQPEDQKPLQKRTCRPTSRPMYCTGRCPGEPSCEHGRSANATCFIDALALVLVYRTIRTGNQTGERAAEPGIHWALESPYLHHTLPVAMTPLDEDDDDN